jgi:hypothetical protein
MSSCEDTNTDIDKAIKEASKIALKGIYNKILEDTINKPGTSSFKDTYTLYNVDDTNVFHADLFANGSQEYDMKDRFNWNFNLGSKELLTNGKHNLFIYNENDNTSNIYANCAAKHGNKWFTSSNISNNSNVCTIDKNNIQLPTGLEFNSDKSLITLNLKSKDPNKNAYSSYEYRENKAYCENRWYDWIITPNYYLGNTYFKDIGKYTENDIFKCYKPCDGDRMPYTTSKGEYKCIHKKNYENGIFSKKYMFSPIGLINLIGNIAMFNNTLTADTDVKNTSIYILHNLIINYKLINNVDTDIYITNSNLKNVIENSNLYNEYSNIITDFKKCVDDNILQDFEESKQDYKNSNFFSYKSPLFNENEPELYTIKGLDANNILIDPILLHTWILANIFKPLDDDNISTFATAYDTMRKLLYEKLWDYFNDEYKAARLKNIFFKAVNMCYDNKTDFSRNIIKYTKKSLTSSTNNLIINKYLTNYNNANYIIPKFNDITVDIFTVNAIDNFKENKYYDSLYSLEKKLKDNDEYAQLYVNTNTLAPFNDQSGNKLKNKYKYFYSVESLEKDICDGEYNEYGKCLIEQPVTQTNIDDNKNKDDKGLNDEFNMPNFKNLILLFLRIVVVIIIIYIIYIFKDIFGETISVFLNTIYVNFLETFYITLNEKFGNDNDTSKYWKDKAKADKIELENVEYKIRKMEEFKKENDL